MVEFWPSNPKVPGSTSGHNRYFFSFCLQNFNFWKFSHSNYILEAKQPFQSLFEHPKVTQKWYVPLVHTRIWTRDLSYQSPTPHPLGHGGNELFELKTIESILIFSPFDQPSLRHIGSMQPAQTENNCIELKQNISNKCHMYVSTYYSSLNWLYRACFLNSFREDSP